MLMVVVGVVCWHSCESMVYRSGAGGGWWEDCV